MQEAEKNTVSTNLDTWDINHQARMWQAGTLGIVLILLRRLWIEICLCLSLQISSNIHRLLLLLWMKSVISRIVMEKSSGWYEVDFRRWMISFMNMNSSLKWIAIFLPIFVGRWSSRCILQWILLPWQLFLSGSMVHIVTKWLIAILKASGKKMTMFSSIFKIVYPIHLTQLEI